MKTYLVRLSFKGPVHPGHDEAGIGVEAVMPLFHSDTIFSAFCNAWADTMAGLDAMDDVAENPPAIFSSSYPYYLDGKGALTYYLPRPILPLPSAFGSLNKAVRRTEYLSLEQFEAWTASNVSNEESFRKLKKDDHDFGSFYVTQVRPRQNTDRLDASASIYHCGEIFFRKTKELSCGLYFLAQSCDEGLLRSGLDILQYRGLGGIRSSGYGKFEWELEGPLSDADHFSSLFAQEGNAYCLLSLYCPANDETPVSGALAYNTVLRKGWFLSNATGLSLKRNTCRMFAEGSVFKEKPAGKILDLSPEMFKKTPGNHPVLRCGLAMSVPIRLDERLLRDMEVESC